MNIVIGFLSLWLVSAPQEPDWVQLRIYSQTDTVEINFPVVLVQYSADIMPADAKLKLEKGEIDLIKLINELGEDRSKFLEIETESTRVEMGFIPITKVRSPTKHPPKDFKIEVTSLNVDTKDFSLRVSLRLLWHLIMSSEQSEGERQFWNRLAETVKKPGRYLIMRTERGEEQIEVFLE